MSCLHATYSSGRLRCTAPYYCPVSLRNRGTCSSLPYHTPEYELRASDECNNSPLFFLLLLVIPSHFSNNNLSLTAVRGYFWVSFLQLNHVWVRFLGIFLPNRYQHAAVWCNLSIIASDLPGMRHSTFMYTCSRRVRPIYSYRPTNSGARRLAVLLLC